MRALPVLAALAAPSFAAAQVPASTLGHSANRSVFELTTRTPIYRHLRDTSAVHPKYLRPGSLVAVRQEYQRWVAVGRTKSRLRFPSDSTTYYVPRAAFIVAKRFVLLMP